VLSLLLLLQATRSSSTAAAVLGRLQVLPTAALASAQPALAQLSGTWTQPVKLQRWQQLSCRKHRPVVVLLVLLCLLCLCLLLVGAAQPQLTTTAPSMSQQRLCRGLQQTSCQQWRLWQQQSSHGRRAAAASAVQANCLPSSQFPLPAAADLW
jgi:hypothetical protein